MSAFIKVPLGDAPLSIIDGDRGAQYPKKTEFTDHGFCLFLNTSNVTSSGFDFSSMDFVTSERDTALRKGKLKRHDVVLTTRGTVGNCAYFGDSVSFEHVRINSGMVILRSDPEQLDPKFLYAFFRSEIFKSQTNTHSSGSAQPQLPISSLRNIVIPFFDVRDQRRIASVLSTLDAKIELNQRINAELEGMAKLLYDYWFVQFDFPMSAAQAAAHGKPRLAGQPYQSSGGKMTYHPALKREIPAGWEMSSLTQCIDRIIDNRGKTPTKLGGDWSTEDDAIIALSAKIVKGGKLVGVERANKVDQELYDKWMPSKLMDGDILMTSEAPAGEFYFILGKTDYCLSQRLFAIRADQTKILPAYLYHELSQGHGYSEIMGSLSGSTVFGIRQDVLRTIKVVIPDMAIQKKFEDTAIPLLRKIKLLEQQNQELTALRDWLLPMLMNGQVTVR